VANETVAISIGSEGCQETLRSALAMGIDRAIHIKTEATFDPINIAKILFEMARQEKPDLILLGKQAIDDDCNQTGQMLAALLGWPQGTFASRLSVHSKTIDVTREIDGGLEILELNLPALVTTDLRLNKPRYPSLPNIMKAKQKPFDTLLLESLSLDLKPHMIIKEVTPPPKKKGGIKVDSVQELIAKLHEEARVI
jgi:electron transfer flavoprotein beta subunit